MKPQQEDSKEATIARLVEKLVGVTPEQAQRCVDEAKLKIEAAAMAGVAGFWS